MRRRRRVTSSGKWTCRDQNTGISCSRAIPTSRLMYGMVARWLAGPIPAFSILLSGWQNPFCMSTTISAVTRGSMYGSVDTSAPFVWLVGHEPFHVVPNARQVGEHRAAGAGRIPESHGIVDLAVLDQG